MSKIIEYPSTHPALREFRQAATQMTGDTHAEPLSRIVAVGVPFNGQHFFSLRDPKYIKNALNNLAANDIPVNPDFVFIPMDMNFKQDFLDPKNDLKPDIVIFAFIAGIGHPEREAANIFLQKLANVSFSLKRPFISFETPHYFKRSPFDKGIQSWEEAIERAAPKVVISYSVTQNDIRTDHFKSSLYVEGPCANLPEAAHTMYSRIRKDYAANLKRTAAHNL